MSDTVTTTTTNPAPSLAQKFSDLLDKGLDLGAKYLGSTLAIKQAKAEASITSANAAAMAAAAGSSTPSGQTSTPAWLIPVVIVGAVLGVAAVIFGLSRRR